MAQAASFDITSTVDLQEVLLLLREAGCTILEVKMSEEGQEQTIEVVVRPTRHVRTADVAARIAQVPDVRNVDWTD